MKMLVIDIFNFVMGVVVVEENKVIGEIIMNLKKNYFVCVMNVVEFLLKDCDIVLSELDCVVVVYGFGFYIGVCIGVIIVKIFVWILNIFLIGVFSFEVLVVNGCYFDGYIVLLFDVCC